MERGIFKYIWSFSGRDQIVLMLLSAAALPVLYFSFELPKTIINQAIGGEGGFPKHVLGADFEQVPYLLLLCGAFLALVLINLAFKYFTSTYRYRVGDRLLRRLRFDLIERLMRFPSRELRNTSGGQVVSMVTAETSPLGFFFAEAFAVPAVAIGTLSTIVLFMFMQDWLMGIAAVSLFPLQLYLIPKIQRRINALQRDEVQEVRQMAQRIGDIVAGAHEIHGNDTSQYELADVSNRLGNIFKIRVNIGSNRYIVNILNTFFSQLTPFFFLSIGGYLVITGKISIGSLVAVLAAYKDMYAPWKDLIDYYQKAEDARVKYDQLLQFFEPPGLLDKSVLAAEPPLDALTGGTLTAANLVVESEDGVKPVDGANVALQLPAHAVIIGGSGSGSEEFARVLSRQVVPRSGHLAIGAHSLSDMPDSVAGRRIGYVGSDAYFTAGTVRDAIVYSLLHRPEETPHDLSAHRLADRREAALVGNSSHDFSADWIDYAAAGCANPADLTRRIIAVLRIVGLDREIYELGLRRAIDPEKNPDIAAKVIAAREVFHDRLENEKLTAFIEPFNAERYMANASVAENIIFGTPVGPYFTIDNLGQNAYMLRIIEEVGLTQEFFEKGRKLAATMVDIFRDLTPGHEFFHRFSFINGEDLPLFEAILRRAEAHGLEGLDGDDRAHLLALPFKLVVNQHHLGLIDAAMETRLLAARKAFARDLPADLQGSVQFFNAATYNAAGSIADNVIFGKIAANRADSAPLIGRLLSDVLDKMGLRDDVIELGLGFEIGIGGTRLSTVQRQKLALGRALLKRADILILNDALSVLDPAEQDSIFAKLKVEMAGRSLFLIESGERRAAEVDHVLRMDQGKIVAGTEVVATKPAHDAHAAGDVDVELNDVVAILMRIPLFAGIDRSKLKLLAFTSHQTTFDAGHFVFRQGDTGDNAYVVIDGEVEVVLESVAGPRTVAVLGRDQVFGEMALLSKGARTTSIRARTSATLLVIASDVFLRLVEENSAIAANVMRTLAARLASTLQDYGKVTASHDLTTGLPTQRVFLENAQQAQAFSRRYGKSSAVLVFDLEGLSSAAARAAYDELPSVTKEAAQRMRQCLRGGDFLARLRNDQYGIVLGEFSGDEDARFVATRIVDTLTKPFTLRGENMTLQAPIAFRWAVLDGDSVADTLDNCWTKDAFRFELNA